MWPSVIAWVGTSILSYATRPKTGGVTTERISSYGPSTTAWNGVPDDASPLGVKDFRVPVAADGKVIPVLFGTREVAQANVVWYGDFKTSPIREDRIETGLVTSTFEVEEIEVKQPSKK